MQDPKMLYGHQDWPPSASVEREDCVEGHYDWNNNSAREEVKSKLEEGR